MNFNDAAIIKFKEELKSELASALNPRFDRIEHTLDRLTDVYTEHSDALGRLTDVCTEHSDALDRLTDVCTEHSDALDRLTDVCTEHSDALDRLTDVCTEHGEVLDRLTDVCTKNGKGIREINRKIDFYYELERDVITHDRLFKEHSERLGILESKLGVVVRVFKKNRGKVKKL